MELTMQITSLVLSLAAAIFAGMAAFRKHATQRDIEALKKEMQDELQDALQTTRTDITTNIAQNLRTSGQLQTETQKQLAEWQARSIEQMRGTVNDNLVNVQRIMKNTAMENEQKLENIRKTMETGMQTMQVENSKKLDEMRQTVDEKLQKTLEEKLQKSFSTVSDQLERVYKGLGEMQTLATGVGDLKKVLSNVKTRGILGEIQLGAILEQILNKEQYEENIATVKGSSERVEYAIKLPGDGETPVYLPIDAKFPMEDYLAYQNALESADKAAAEAAAKALEAKIKSFAKDIHTKYIHAPETTDFGIMFLPVEGLYATVVQRGMIEKLQADYKVIIAGPTTMSALLNSLQMGFKTLAIQQRSGEVWKVLGNVKSEFDTFGKALAQAQNRINQAGNELENLVGVRTRQIQRRLKDVTVLQGPEEEAALPQAAIPLAADADDDTIY